MRYINLFTYYLLLMSRVSVLTHDKNRISVGYKVTTIVLRPGLLLVYVS